MKKGIISIVMITLLLGACSPKYYVANTQNVPLISKKGETNLTFSGNGDQVEFQGAYGVTDNFSIMLTLVFLSLQILTMEMVDQVVLLNWVQDTQSQ